MKWYVKLLKLHIRNYEIIVYSIRNIFDFKLFCKTKFFLNMQLINISLLNLRRTLSFSDGKKL